MEVKELQFFHTQCYGVCFYAWSKAKPSEEEKNIKDILVVLSVEVVGSVVVEVDSENRRGHKYVLHDRSLEIK